MRRHAALLVLVSLMVAPPAACTTAGPASAPSPAPAHSEDLLRVESRHWEDVTVYLVRHSTLIPLGIVEAYSSRRFALSLLGRGAELRLRAMTRVSRTSFTSVPFTLSPGQRVEWVLEGNAAFSTLTVR